MKQVYIIQTNAFKSEKEAMFFERVLEMESMELVQLIIENPILQKQAINTINSAHFETESAFDIEFIYETNAQLSHHIQGIIEDDILQLAKLVTKKHGVMLPYKGFEVNFQANMGTASVSFTNLEASYDQDSVEFVTWLIQNMAMAMGNKIIVENYELWIDQI